MELQFTSVETQIALQFLHPYYNYTCVVAAVTVATGPSSTELTVTTLQDGMYEMDIQPYTNRIS